MHLALLLNSITPLTPKPNSSKNRYWAVALLMLYQYKAPCTGTTKCLQHLYERLFTALQMLLC